MSRNPIIRLRNHIAFKKQLRRYPNIINSGVSHPDLIAPTACVNHSNLNGAIHIGEYARIEGPLLLLGDITIGRYTGIYGPNTDIRCAVHPITIGAFCSIARNVTIQEYNHPIDRCSTYNILSDLFAVPDAAENVSKGPVIIEHDVWIGTESVILSGSWIGSGAVIGANSVVTSEIPPYAVAVGSPAKVIRYRFSKEMIERLLNLQWWDWPRERILRNRVLFEGELTMNRIDHVQ